MRRAARQQWFGTGRGGARLLACCLLASAASAADPTLELAPDPVVRPGTVYRCRITGHDLPSGAQVLTVALVEGDRVLAASELACSEREQITSGVTAALLPEGAVRAPLLRVRLSDARGRSLLQVEQAVPGMIGRDNLTALRTLPALQPPLDPLPQLWLEQADELLLRPVPSLAEHRQLVGLLAALAEWPQHPPASDGVETLALRDLVDGSVQPWRLTRATGATRVVVLARGAAVTKSAWAPLPASWVSAAAAAHVAIAEVYPAGDREFVGAARRRISLVQAAASAATGLANPAIGMANDGLAEPAAWLAPQPLPELVPPVGRLVDWAQGPFVVVVGTGEHRAAREDARALAAAFVRAWAMHAHGYPPVVEDRAYDPVAWAGHHLVLIGSPRCNAVTHTFAAALPVDWDDRELRVGSRIVHRSRLPGLAVALADPARPARSLLVLDGQPAWRCADGELPLAAEATTADLVLRPGDASEGPVLRLLLESRPARP